MPETDSSSLLLADNPRRAEEAREPAGLLPCWCGANKWETVFRAPRAGLAHCPNCDCYQTDPPPLRSSERSEEFYSDYYEHVQVDCTAIENRATSRNSGFWRVAEQIPELNRAGGTAADFGSGSGHLCAELKGAGWKNVIGVEVSAIRARQARATYPDITFHSSPLDRVPIPEGSLDLAIMEAVIEHLPDPLTNLRALKRYTRPGGRVVLTTPNMDSGHFRLLGKRWTGMLAPHAHVFLFSEKSIATALHEAGLEVEAVGSFREPPYSVGQWARRVLAGDVKGAMWRAHQECGTLYGRSIGKGAMLFAVARA